MMSEGTRYQDQLITDLEILVGKPVVNDLRISMELALDYLTHTLNLQELCTDCPHLTLEDIQVGLEYA